MGLIQLIKETKPTKISRCHTRNQEVKSDDRKSDECANQSAALFSCDDVTVKCAPAAIALDGP